MMNAAESDEFAVDMSGSAASHPHTYAEAAAPHPKPTPAQPQTIGGIPADMAASVGQHIAGNVLNAGAQQAKGFMDRYANIDILRPYFNVEPSDIRTRLLQALRPRFSREPQVIPGDMYGPVVLAFTLVAVLLLGMKANGHVAREGTLMGTAFAVVFGYWFTATGIFYATCFVFNTDVSLAELLSVTGYGLFGHCIVLLLSHAVPGETDFYAAWLLFGTLSALKMAMVLRSRTADRKQGLIIAALVFATHWLYLKYLHYAYATLVQAVSPA